MARSFPARFLKQPGEPKQARKPEAVFASKVMKWLRDLYGDHLWELGVRGGLGMRSGVPDRLLCIDGRFLAIEFKNPDGSGRLGPKQKFEIEQLRNAGAVVYVIQNWQQVEEIVKEFPPRQMMIK